MIRDTSFAIEIEAIHIIALKIVEIIYAPHIKQTFRELQSKCLRICTAMSMFPFVG